MVLTISGGYDPNHKSRKVRFVVGVKVLIFDKKGRLLIIKRSNKTKSGGLWSFPGGSIDKGEDIQEAAKRETNEEMKLDISNIQVFDVTILNSGKKDEAVVIGFSAKARHKKVELNWEHDDYKWIDVPKSSEYDLTPYAKYIIGKFLKQQS